MPMGNSSTATCRNWPGCPQKVIHALRTAKPLELQMAGVTLGQNYPALIVAHDAARALTLQRYAIVKKKPPACSFSLPNK